MITSLVKSSYRGQMLEESYAFQQFSANIDEEEAWIAEKQRLLSGGDLGDTMAAVQVKCGTILPGIPCNFSIIIKKG